MLFLKDLGLFTRRYDPRGLKVCAMDPIDGYLVEASLYMTSPQGFSERLCLFSLNSRGCDCMLGEFIEMEMEMESSHPINESHPSRAWPRDTKPLLLRGKG